MAPEVFFRRFYLSLFLLFPVGTLLYVDVIDYLVSWQKSFYKTQRKNVINVDFLLNLTLALKRSRSRTNQRSYLDYEYTYSFVFSSRKINNLSKKKGSWVVGPKNCYARRH